MTSDFERLVRAARTTLPPPRRAFRARVKRRVVHPHRTRRALGAAAVAAALATPALAALALPRVDLLGDGAARAPSVAAPSAASATPQGARPAQSPPVVTKPSIAADETVACTTPTTAGGGFRVWAAANFRKGEIRFPANVRVDTGGGTAENLVLVLRGNRRTFVNRSRCTRSRLRVRLASAGLPGGLLVENDERAVDCFLRGRVVVRARVTRDRAGRVVAGYVGVRLERGRLPIAFAELTRAGNVRFYASRRCLEH